MDVTSLDRCDLLNQSVAAAAGTSAHVRSCRKQDLLQSVQQSVCRSLDSYTHTPTYIREAIHLREGLESFAGRASTFRSDELSASALFLPLDGVCAARAAEHVEQGEPCQMAL